MDDLAGDRLPRAVRKWRHLRAGDPDPDPPAASAAVPSAPVAVRGGGRVEGLRRRGRVIVGDGDGRTVLRRRYGAAPRAGFGSAQGSLPADRAQQGQRAHGGGAERRGHRCRVPVPLRRAEDRAGAGERDRMPVHRPATQTDLDWQEQGPSVSGHGRTGRRRDAVAAENGRLPAAAVAAVVARDRRTDRSPRWRCSRSS